MTRNLSFTQAVPKNVNSLMFISPRTLSTGLFNMFSENFTPRQLPPFPSLPLRGLESALGGSRSCPGRPRACPSAPATAPARRRRRPWSRAPRRNGEVERCERGTGRVGSVKYVGLVCVCKAVEDKFWVDFCGESVSIP